MAVPLLARSALLGSALQEYSPAPEVSLVAVCTWESDAGFRGKVRVLPDGCADLIWDGAELRVAGVQTGMATHGVTRTRAVGVRLHPYALGPLLGVPASELPAGPVDVADIWAGAAHGWSHRLSRARRPADARRTLEDLVAARLAAGHGPDPFVAATARQLAAPCASLDDVVSRVGLSARELRRRFHHDVGLGPKHLQRILRFRGFVRCLGAVAQRQTTLARVAAELGYADQAHVSRECREMAGRSPRALAATWSMHVSETES